MGHLLCARPRARTFFFLLHSRSTEKGEIRVVWTEDSKRLPGGVRWGNTISGDWKSSLSKPRWV